MRITLLIPELLWSEPADSEAFAGAEKTPFAKILGHLSPVRSASMSAEFALLKLLGLPAHTSLAALRAGADNIVSPPMEMPVGDWLCADPVHLRFHQERLVLGDGRALAMSEGELAVIEHALNEAFAASPAPTRFFLRGLGGRRGYVWLGNRQGEGGTRPLSMLTPLLPLSRRIGCEIRPADLGQDPAVRQLANEIQMLLHAHPVNQARSAAGKPTLNALWLWGNGKPLIGASAPPAASPAADASPTAAAATKADAPIAATPPEAATPETPAPNVVAPTDSVENAPDTITLDDAPDTITLNDIPDTITLGDTPTPAVASARARPTAAAEAELSISLAPLFPGDAGDSALAEIANTSGFGCLASPGTDPLVIGLAKALNMPVVDPVLPALLRDDIDTLFVVNALTGAAQYQDSAAYAKAWARLEQSLLAPLLSALMNLQLKEIKVVSPCAYGTLTWTLTPLGAWVRTGATALRGGGLSALAHRLSERTE